MLPTALPAPQMVSMPKPETMPLLRAAPMAGKVPNRVSMSVDGVFAHAAGVRGVVLIGLGALILVP